MDVMRASRVLGLVAAAALLAGCEMSGREADEGGAPDTLDTMDVGADTQVVILEDVGLQTPESVLHDPDADVYLVSNINGEPTGHDGNGFISRVRPDGSMEALKWIDGAAEAITLHAPKGMALKGDTLFVADIDSVRAFNRQSGEALGARGVPDADFLNDLAVHDDALYVTDTGVDASFSPTGRAAIYRFGADGAEVVARGDELASPNGIAFSDGDLLVAPFGSTEVRRLVIGDEGTGEVVATLPGGQLDGIIALDDGGFLVSSWETSTVYQVDGAGQAVPLVEDVDSPADIGWDEGRRRVLVPLFMGNRLEMHPVRDPSAS